MNSEFAHWKQPTEFQGNNNSNELSGATQICTTSICSANLSSSGLPRLFHKPSPCPRMPPSHLLSALPIPCPEWQNVSAKIAWCKLTLAGIDLTWMSFHVMLCTCLSKDVTSILPWMASCTCSVVQICFMAQLCQPKCLFRWCPAWFRNWPSNSEHLYAQ